MEADVPLLIPEVNADHLALLDAQGARAAGRAASSPTRTASSWCYAMALAPLRQFGLKTSMITTLQAISGAGYPGVPSWDILGNVIPFIGGGEEEKIETETNKILGALKNGAVENHPVTISAAVTRVPVQNGHTGSIAVALDRAAGARGDHRGVERRSAASRRSWSCRRRRRSRSSTSPSRTVRSRRSTPTATAA